MFDPCRGIRIDARTFGLLIGLSVGVLLVGCAADDWMQRSCIKQGFQPGTADYDACLAREKAWSDKLDRYGRGGGP